MCMYIRNTIFWSLLQIYIFELFISQFDAKDYLLQNNIGVFNEIVAYKYFIAKIVLPHLKCSHRALNCAMNMGKDYTSKFCHTLDIKGNTLKSLSYIM